MASNAERGMKRTCAACSSRFYDLNRDTITCPICGAVYERNEEEIAEDALIAEAKAEELKLAKRPAIVPDVDDDDEDDVDEAADLVDLEDEDEDADAATSEDDNTFLEEDDDNGSDVTGIIGGGVAEDDDTDA